MISTDIDLCPRCGGALEYDEVDIGVGVMRGNPGCPACYWTPPNPLDQCLDCGTVGLHDCQGVPGGFSNDDEAKP